MNVVLWVLQGALALLCISGGAFQIFKIKELEKGVAAMRALPHALWAGIGLVNCLGGVGLVVPGLLGLAPVIVPVAAGVVAGASLGVSALYVRHGDKAPLPYSLVMAALGVAIAVGRA